MEMHQPPASSPGVSGGGAGSPRMSFELKPRSARGIMSRTAFRCCPPFVLALASFAALCLLSLSPRAGSPVAAVFPPWAGLSDIVRALETVDVRLVRTGAFENVVILEQGTAGTPSRLRGAGAWLVLDGVALSACLSGL